MVKSCELDFCYNQQSLSFSAYHVLTVLLHHLPKLGIAKSPHYLLWDLCFKGEKVLRKNIKN